jgi:hypothetical protein
MRCLHCGKDIPLFKRLSGGEFCSDAHRREYQQEYSKLALSRLMHPVPEPGMEKPPVAPLPLPAPPQLSVTPSSTQAPTNAKAPVVHAAVNPGAIPLQPATTSAAVKPTVTPPVPGPTRSDPATKTAAQPAVPLAGKSMRPAEDRQAPPLASVLIRKPAVAAPNFESIVLPESGTLIAAAVPYRPSRRVSLPPVELAVGTQEEWKRTCDIRNSPSHPAETRLELRNFVRATPVADFDLRADGTENWNVAEQRMEMPDVAVASPADASLWHACAREFTVSMTALHNILDVPLSAKPVDHVEDTNSQSIPEFPSDTLALDQQSKPLPPVPLPLEWKGMAPGRAKPVQVFQSWVPNEKTAETVPPEILPLRPVMVLVPIDKDHPQPGSPVIEAVVSPAAPSSPLLISPVPLTASAASTISQDDLGLPEFRLQPSGAEIAARIWTKVVEFRGRKETANGAR